jgi:hypothetical protein
MSSAKDLKESEVPTVLNFSILITIIELDILDAGLIKSFLARPL